MFPNNGRYIASNNSKITVIEGQMQWHKLGFELRTEKEQALLDIQKLVNAFCKIGFCQIFIAIFSWYSLHLAVSGYSGGTFELPERA